MLICSSKKGAAISATGLSVLDPFVRITPVFSRKLPVPYQMTAISASSICRSGGLGMAFAWAGVGSM